VCGYNGNAYANVCERQRFKAQFDLAWLEAGRRRDAIPF
jgi:hypothetical protein